MLEFKGCDENTINILGKDMILYINHATNWIYTCLLSNDLRLLDITFMNELTVALRNQHISVKNFSFFPSRSGTGLEILCINFEQDHERVEELISDATSIPTSFPTPRYI